MNDILRTTAPRRRHQRINPRPVHFFVVSVLWAILSLTGLTGCDSRSAVSVQLQTRPIQGENLTRLQVEAQVAGPVAGLHYRWFAVSGECEPQESTEPQTVFRFPEGVRQDRVSVEVWRGDTRVAQAEVKVKFDDSHSRLSGDAGARAKISITRIPPFEKGGPESSNYICGAVSGNVTPGLQVLVYVRAYGSWYIQPTAQSMHPLRSDSSWATWTHTGSRYAALLVRPELEPMARLDMLPPTNEMILATAIVDGIQTNGTPEPAQ